MGRDHQRISVEIGVAVSRHNDPRDREDDALAAEIDNQLHALAKKIVSDPRYARINPILLR